MNFLKSSARTARALLAKTSPTHRTSARSTAILNLFPKSLMTKLLPQPLLDAVEHVAVGAMDVVHPAQFVQNDQHEGQRPLFFFLVAEGDLVVDAEEEVGEDGHGVVGRVDGQRGLVRLQDGVAQVLGLLHALFLDDFAADPENGLLELGRHGGSLLDEFDVAGEPTGPESGGKRPRSSPRG